MAVYGRQIMIQIMIECGCSAALRLLEGGKQSGGWPRPKSRAPDKE
jgi:hypothetical protein